MSKIALFILRVYKKNLSPFLEIFFGKACRFTPTCSEYTIQSIEKFGLKKGGWMGIKRILSCNPLSVTSY